MKRSLIIIFGICLSMAMLSGCMKTNADGDSCLSTPTFGCGKILSCSNGTTSYYLVDGVKYYCDGSDCTAAAEDAIDAQCSLKVAEGSCDEKETLMGEEESWDDF